MPLGDSNRFTGLGGNRFAGVMVDYNAMLASHGVNVNVSRVDQSRIGTRNIFGTPVLDNQATPQPYQPTAFQTKILLADMELKESWVVGGGKPVEVAQLIAPAGTLQPNDEIVFGGHDYKLLEDVKPFIGGSFPLEMHTAWREVDVGA